MKNPLHYIQEYPHRTKQILGITNDPEVLNVKKNMIKIAQNMLNFGRRIKIS
jgi:hypothetical protein